MYQDKVSLTPQEILEKEFKIDTRGYRLKEVDQFLDIVISDYEQFIKMIRELEEEKENLLNEIAALKQELRNVKASVSMSRSADREVTNVDLLRRLSQLEKVVYGKDE